MSSPSAAVLRGKGRVIAGPVVGGVAIKASVGKAGRNQKNDIVAVQTALNAVPTLLGGAGDSLQVDGIVGPLTIGAINQFQKRWLTILDGRCDPAGPTLGLLNAMVGVGDALPAGSARLAGVGGLAEVAPKKPKTKPQPPPPPPTSLPPTPVELVAIERAELRQFVVERHHTPLVKRWLLTTVRMVDAARRWVRRLRTIPQRGKLPADERNHPDRRAFLLLAKTFKLHESRVGEASASVEFIDNVFRQSLVVISQHAPRPPVPGPAPQAEHPLFLSLFGVSRNGTDAFAYAFQGGLHLQPGQSKFFNQFIQPGQVLAEQRDRIYLLPFFDSKPPNHQRLTMIHELAHFVTRKGAGAVIEIETIDGPGWRALNHDQRLHTADSYGFFATECNVGTFQAVSDGESDHTQIPINPFVEATSFVRTEPVISIPTLPHTDGPKFDFPAGFLF